MTRKASGKPFLMLFFCADLIPIFEFKLRKLLTRKHMNKFAILLILTVLFSCRSRNEGFYMPAEWESHDAVWFGWEQNETFFYPVVSEMIKALTPHVLVKIAVRSDSLMIVAKKYLAGQGVDTARVRFYLVPGDRYWIRDHGASFLLNGKGKLGAAQFGWNLYGYPEFLKEKFGNNKDSINKYMALAIDPKTKSVDSVMAALTGAAILKTEVCHEGGATEVNGKGTLILCEATVFQRNPGWARADLEKEFKRVLGVSKIIWMKKGLADDPQWLLRRIAGNYIGGGTGGHTDEFVRFAGPNTVLLAWVDEKDKDLNPVNRMNYERLYENLKILEQSTDQDGKPFTVIKVPLPDIIPLKVVAKTKFNMPGAFPPTEVPMGAFIPSEMPQEGDTLLWLPAATYLNYLVTNGVVLLPTYAGIGASKEAEEAVMKIFREQFPNREILLFDVLGQNFSGGGIHCSTQQQPSVKN